MVYDLDYNAGAPTDPRVARAMHELPPEADANPHSPHGLGRAASAILEDARDRMAAALGVGPHEIVLTSGGTEANNIAAQTAVAFARARGGTVLVSPIEHPSVAVPMRSLAAAHGVPLAELRVSAAGVAAPFEPHGVAGPPFASLIFAHHELGVLQDLAAHAAPVRAQAGLLHSDASQALGRVDLAPVIACADYVTLSPHKAGGPRGIGVLIARDARPLEPALRGGAQELGRRPGTQSPRLAAGAALAVELAVRECVQRAAAMQAALDIVLAPLRALGFTPLCEGGESRLLPNTRTVSMAPLEARHVLPALDMLSVFVSYGAACTSGAREPSPSLRAIGVDARTAASCVRVSVGPRLENKKAARASELLYQALAKLATRAREDRV